MEKKEAIKWLYKHADIEPYEGMHEGSQTSYWFCKGCSGEFISRWPKWEKPTVENFPHKSKCTLVEVLKVLSLN